MPDGLEGHLERLMSFARTEEDGDIAWTRAANESGLFVADVHARDQPGNLGRH